MTDVVLYRESMSDLGISVYAMPDISKPQVLIGSAECTRCGDENNNWYFNRLYVRPEYRGQGIGSVLLDKLLVHIRGHNATLLLDINPYGDLDYEQLEAFYIRHGFKKDPKLSYFYR